MNSTSLPSSLRLRMLHFMAFLPCQGTSEIHGLLDSNPGMRCFTSSWRSNSPHLVVDYHSAAVRAAEEASFHVYELILHLYWYVLAKSSD